MAYKFVFTNSKNQTITISNIGHFRLEEVEGISGVGSISQLEKNPFQDGATYLSTSLEPREITITGQIRANGNMADLRKRLLSVLNPKLGKGTLIFESEQTKKRIDCIVLNAPVMPDARGNREANFQRFQFSLLAPGAFWRDVDDIISEIAVWRGSFSFPLEIVESGIEVGFREPSLIVNVFNGGDVGTGMIIDFRANATVDTPSLFNVYTREILKINTIMESGDMIRVNTRFQQKRVELIRNNETTNIFNLLDLESTFLQLDPGDNLLRYDAEDGLDNLEITIRYTPQFMGV